ncbi:uncharacterized protein LOC125888490 [Epinephelus fuscoguttatus]|uniref:uncharacterized protein LOC125888490 n=1 Tax=Epinephelus fuscoguttatus TaxID=293821 RepID=UPI0020D03226|nr:uncharacterized protein LOC125888490 [Epinephelus fuscoguttatus]
MDGGQYNTQEIINQKETQNNNLNLKCNQVLRPHQNNLLWIHRSNVTFQFFSQDYQVEPTPPGPTGTLFTRAAPQELNVSVVAVEGTKTLLLGAFLEHRTYKKKVRVNAVVLRKERVAYCCLLRCQGQLHTSGSFCSIHNDHFGFPYGTADILCYLPSGCQSPSHVTVTTAAAKSKGAPDENFLEVKNHKKRSDSFPYNFTVCFSTMYNFTNVLQLVQSLEMLQLLGVNRVVIYKTNTSPETQRILDYYTQKGGSLTNEVIKVNSRDLSVSVGVTFTESEACDAAPLS